MILEVQPHEKSLILNGTKKHQIVFDKKWRKGQTIQFWMQKCFHKLKCTRKDKLFIDLQIDDQNNQNLVIKVNNVSLNESQMNEFIKNEGFESREEFINEYELFVFPVKGFLIHWTKTKYS